MLHREMCVLEAAAGAAVLTAGENAVVLALSVFVSSGGAVVVSLTEQLWNFGLVEGAASALFFWLFLWLGLLSLDCLGGSFRGWIMPTFFRGFCGRLLLAG